MSEQTLAGIRTEPEARPQPQRRPAVQDAPRINRGAVASVGFVAGWAGVNCCTLGLIPAIATGLGFGSAYFGINNWIFFGMGWTPIWALTAAGVILVVSLVTTRRVFATYPREVAVRHYLRTAGYMGLAAGISFIVWMEVIMPVLFTAGVPMGALTRH